MKKKKIISVLLATAVAGSMVSVTAGCNVDGGNSNLKATNVYFAGDSTVCAFNDTDYYMPRYGYGTQFANYVSDKVTVKNLAYSGASSYSFTQVSNYETIKNNIKAGDYLIISFGHNDESDTDEAKNVKRYTNPNLDTDTAGDISTLVDTAESRPVSFKYVLNKFYIEMAKERGAIPILCTPIVRLSDKDDYTTDKIHNTADRTVNDVIYPGGDYVKAIKDLGKDKSVTVIDLEKYTQADYASLGYAQVKNRHAAKAGRPASASSTQLEAKAIDDTHTNYFGASMNAFYLASDLVKTGNSLGKYVNSNITKPNYNVAFVENSGYEYRVSFDPAKDVSSTWNITAPWYGTVFGDIGMNNHFESAYKIEQNAPDSFTVGGLIGEQWDNDKQEFVPKYNGKISSNSDGFAAAFYQLSTSDNFEITAEVTLDVLPDTDQTAFGIMLRDNIVIDEKLEKADSILSDYIAAGAYTTKSATNVVFSRYDGSKKDENGVSQPVPNKLNTSSNTDDKLTGGKLTEGSVHTLTLQKVGNKVTAIFDNIEVSFNNKADFTEIDDAYMYLCLFATRGTTATFKLTDFKVNNQSKLN